MSDAETTEPTEPMPKRQIGILGGGSMGSAIAVGAAASGATVLVTTRSEVSAEQFGSHSAVQVQSLEAHPDANGWAIADADLVVIAVKPAGVLQLLAEIAPDLGAGTIVVSVAAGIPITAMQSALPPRTPVLRAMPNTPAAIGAGVTGLAAGDAVSDADAALARSVFATVGAVIDVPESQIDALSAISGSGPAYVFYFVEQLLASAKRLGFSDDDARTMVLGTVDGSVRLLVESGKDPATLRRQVTSPKGTTERAIGVFDEQGLGRIVDDALGAAIARARELAAG